jgi:hypothetical protein
VNNNQGKEIKNKINIVLTITYIFEVAMQHKTVSTLKLKKVVPDIRKCIYDLMSIDDLYRLMLTSKGDAEEINIYLDTVVANPDKFFLRLVSEKENAEGLPVGAMMLMNRFHRKYGDGINPVKTALEADGQLITKLFTLYAFNGKALALLNNAISRISSPDRVNELWNMGELKSYHYALITNDVKLLDMPKVKADFFSDYSHEEDNDLPDAILRALNLIVNFRVMAPFRLLDKQRDYYNYPVNLSGTTTIIAKYMPNLCCAVLMNIAEGKHVLWNGFAADNGNNICLFGANLEYNLNNTGNYGVGFCMVDLRYAYMPVKNDAHHRLQLSNCNLRHANIINYRIDHTTIEACNFYNVNLTRSIFHDHSDADWYVDAKDVKQRNNTLVASDHYTYMDLKGASLCGYEKELTNRPDVIKAQKIKLLHILEYNVARCQSINDMGQYARVLSTHCHLLRLKRQSAKIYFNGESSQYLNEDFTSNTHSWKAMISLFKSKCMSMMKYLMNDCNTKLTNDTAFLLYRLQYEKCGTGLFDRKDSEYIACYQDFMKAAQLMCPKYNNNN